MRQGSRAVDSRAPARSRLIPHIDWRGSRDIFRVCLFGILMVNISAIQMYLGPVRLLRPGLLFLILAIGALAMRSALGAWKNLNSWVSKAVFIFFVLACCSGVFGISLGTTGLFIMNVYSRNLLVFFLLILAIRSTKDLAYMMWAFVISVATVVVLAQTVLELEVTREGLGRLSGGSGLFDANDLGMILVMALPIALLFFFNSQSYTKLVSGLTLIGIPVTVALTGSRGALLGMVAVGFAILVSLRRTSVFKRIAVVVVAAAGLYLGAPEGYWDQMATLLNIKEDYNYSVDYGRKGIAMRGFGYMLRYPLFGVGSANFGRAEGTISSLAVRRAGEGLSVEWIAPHNTYVQVGAEMGVPALIIWLSLLGSGTIGLWRLRRRLPKSWDTDSADRRFLRDACLFLPISFLGFIVS
ncbi:MAG: O-antigen ligase family protein, partial [Longimicrobiales bacterium]